MTDPIIVPDKRARTQDQSPIATTGTSFDVHYTDDEAWHVLEGTLTFRLRDLISALEADSREEHNEIMRRFESEMLE